MFKNFFEYKALTVNRYFVALFTAYFALDGFSQDFWNESGRTEKHFTTPWITDIRRSRSVTRKLVPVPGVRGSSKRCIAFLYISPVIIAIDFVSMCKFILSSLLSDFQLQFAIPSVQKKSITDSYFCHSSYPCGALHRSFDDFLSLSYPLRFDF